MKYIQDRDARANFVCVMLFSYTEVQVVFPENGIVGLHADNLVIERVTVNGEVADFEVFPHYLHLDSDNR